MRVEGVGNIRSVAKIDSVKAVDEQAKRIENEKVKNPEKNTAAKEDRWANPGMVKAEGVSIGEQELIEAIERANKALRGVDKRFEFSIHEDTKEIMVKVINDETDEVIREIPPEKILDMVAKMWELAGILVDRKI